MLARASLARIEASYERLREFTADASHELRSPLTALSMTAAVALHEAPGLAESTKNRLISIASTAKDMNRLVDDLLILARAGRSLEREMFTVHVDTIVSDVIRAPRRRNQSTYRSPRKAARKLSEIPNKSRESSQISSRTRFAIRRRVARCACRAAATRRACT
jgi:signal transduction histidine kinase